MYTKNFFLFVAAGASTVTAGSVFAERAIQARDSSNGGWSLQSSSAVSGLNSCGDGAYCPSTSTCFPAQQDVAVACCPTSTNCRGTIEGAPSCADPSWSLYYNDQGNGFCCEVGQVGAFDPSASTGAGFCTTSVNSSDTSARLISSGTGSASTSVVSSAASTVVASTTAVSTAAVTSTASTASETGSASATESSSGSSSTTGSSSASATSGATASSSGNSTSASGSASSSATGGSSSGAVQNAVASGLGLLFAGLAFAILL